MNDDTKNFAASIFTARPDSDAKPLGIPVWRAPQKGEGGCIILSESIIGCWTHFLHGRTQPCFGDGCTACVEEISRRWKGWLVGWAPKERSLRIVELPAGAAVAVADFQEERGSLRGCGIKLSRRNNKINGPVVVALAAGVVDSSLLPPCPELAVLMLRVFQIKGDRLNFAVEKPARIYNADGGEYNQVTA